MTFSNFEVVADLGNFWTTPYICWEEEKLQLSSGGVTMRDHDKWLLDSKYTR